jgi:hypothetical protein
VGRSVFSRLVAALVLAPFLAPSTVLVPAVSSAQDVLPEPSLSLEGLERHFDRADRAPDVAFWLDEAERGLAAVSDWEQARARQRLTERLTQHLKRSLDEKLGGELLDVRGANAIGDLRALERSYLYQAEGGAITVDSVGDPLLRGAEGAVEDHTAWRASIDARRGELLDAWSLQARVAYDEILGEVDGEYRSAVSEELSATLDDYVARVQREFDRLAIQSESRLLRGRLRDTYSLRRKSEGESAGALAAGLVSSTEEKLSSADQILRTTTVALVTERDIAALDVWEENYKGAFQAGLDAWSQAEAHLFEERLAWETKSQETYVEAEAAWDAAFADLDQARTTWLMSMQEIIESGRAAWDALEQTYDEELSRSVSDLAAAAAEEQAKIRRELGAYRRAYDQALGILALAEKNRAYFGQELENLRRSLDLELDSIRNNEVRGSQLVGTERRIDELTSEIAFLEGEKGYWDDLAESYRSTAESVAGTVDTLGSGDRANARDRELSRRLDGHIELLTHQRDIAQAVVDYARDRSSGRATEAATRERLSAAKLAYTAAETAYLSQIDALEEMTRELGEYQSLVSVAEAELLRVTAEYQAKRETYDSLWLSWIAQDTTTIQRAVERLDDEIDAFYESDRLALYSGYFDASEASFRNDVLDQAAAIVDELPDLRETAGWRDRILAVVVPLGGDPGLEPRTPEEIATEYVAAGLSSDDENLVALLEAYRVATGSGGPNEPFPEPAAWDAVGAALDGLTEAVTFEYERLAETIAFLRREEMTEEEYQIALEGPFGDVYREYAEFAPSRVTATRVEAATELAVLLGRTEEKDGRITFGALDSIATADEALTLFEVLSASGQAPAYIAGVVRDYLAAHIGPLGLAAVEERPELEAELEATTRALELADDYGTSLTVAAEMYRAFTALGPDGDPARRATEGAAVEGFLLGQLGAYIDRRAKELGDHTPEARALIMHQGLDAVGIAPGLFGSERPEPVLSTTDLEAVTDILTRHYVRLSAERSAIRDFAITAEGARKLSGDARYAADGVTVFRGLLARGLQAMGADAWDEGIDEDAAEASLAALSSRVQRHREALSQRGQLEEALTVGSTGRRAYFESAVVPVKQELEMAAATLTEERRGYQSLLDGLESRSSSYTDSRGVLDTLYHNYVSARRELQLSEELFHFAAHGYELDSRGPEDVLADRQRELDRVSRIREIVASLEVNPEIVGPTDEVYLHHAARLASLREAKSYLLYASEQFEKQIGAAAVELSQFRSKTAGAAYELFRLPEGLSFDPDFPALGSVGAGVDRLTRFNDADPEAFMADVQSYFVFDTETREDVNRAAGRYSTDIARWIAGVAVHGGAELLRDFGLAIHRERPRYSTHAPDAPAIPIEIEANQVYNAILDHSKIGNINTQSVRNLINVRADEALGRIGAHQERQALYTFFKAMFLSGHLSLDTSYISYDTSAIAREEARFRARKAYEFHNGRGKRMWRGRLRRRIRHLYEDLPNYSGSGPRGGIFGSITSFASALTGYRKAQEQLNRLSGAAGGMIDETLLRAGIMAIGDARGAPAPGTSSASAVAFQAARTQALDYIVGAIGTLSPSEKGSTFHAVQGLLSEIESDLAATQDAMNRRLSVLAGARAVDQAAYDYFAGASELDEEALSMAAAALFSNPAFSPDTLLESQVAAAEDVAVFSHAGAAERMGYLTDALGQLETYSVSLLADDEAHRLSADRAELATRRSNWEATVADLYRTGLRDFRGAFAYLAQERRRWREEFRADYIVGSSLWDQKYELFQGERRSWTEGATAATVSGTSSRLARRLGLSAESLIAGIEDIDIPALDFESRSIDRVIARSLDDRLLTTLLDYADTLSSRADSRRPAIAASLPTIRSPSGSWRLALSASTDITDEIHARAAVVAALQLRDSLDHISGSIDERLFEANRLVERNFAVTFRSAGYTRNGDSFQRQAVIDESFFGGIEREIHRIGAYRYFDAPDLFLTTDITAAGLSGLSGTLVEARIEEAQQEMQSYLVLIFGRSEQERRSAGGSGVGSGGVATLEELTERLDESLVTRLTAETARFVRSAQYDRHKDTEGLFNLYVGYAPVMKESDPERVRIAGYGESGRIMEAFYRNEARLGRGLAAMQTPWYDLKLYDDDKDNDGDSDGLIGAPTSRGVANIAASVAALATGNVWAAAMINLADDAAFGVADAASGRMSWQEAGASFGRRAAVGFATTATGGVFSGFENASGFWTDGLAGTQVGSRAMGDSVLGSMAIAGGEAFVNSNISGAAGALEWDGTGILGLGYNGTRWADNVVGRDALVGYASGATQAGTTTSLANRWSLETHGFAVSEGTRLLDPSAASQFAGEVAGESLTTGLTGRATVNLANFSGIAKSLGWEAFYHEESGTWARHGLAELSIGPIGAQVQLGGEGLDVSASNWRRVAAATRDIREIKGIQQDLDLAAIQRDYLAGITDRAIGVEEALIGATSSEAENLLAQLALIRRDQSRGNVYSMFNPRRNEFSEAELDESLSISMGQGDLSLDEFMHSTAFDTQGAFLIAAALKEGGAITLEDLFSSQKAYAGREYEGSKSFDTRRALFGEYLRLRMREDVENAEALLGGDLFHATSQIARRMLDDGDDLESVMNLVVGDVEAAGSLHSDITDLKAAMNSEEGHAANLSANDVRGALAELLYRETIVNAPAESVSVAGAAGTPDSAFPAMMDATYTSAPGHRILTQAMIEAGVSGELYEFGLNKHDGADYFSPDGRFIAVFEGELSFLRWNDDKGLGIALQATNNDGRLHEFHYYHNSPDSVDRFALAVLASGGFTVPGGSVIGATGPDMTGLGTGDYGHLHAEYFVDEFAYDPALLGGQYLDMSSYAQHMSGISPELREPPRERSLDLDILAGVEAYSRSAEPDYFRSYMKHHTGYSFENMEEYLSYLDFLHRGGARR